MAEQPQFDAVVAGAGMAGLYSFRGRYQEADALFRETMALRGSTSDRAAGATNGGERCQPGDDALFSELGILRYREGYYAVSPRRDPRGPGKGTSRVVRGGCWGNDDSNLRAGLRFGDRMSGWMGGLGFRVVLPTQQ